MRDLPSPAGSPWVTPRSFLEQKLPIQMRHKPSFLQVGTFQLRSGYVAAAGERTTFRREDRDGLLVGKAGLPVRRHTSTSRRKGQRSTDPAGIGKESPLRSRGSAELLEDVMFIRGDRGNLGISNPELRTAVRVFTERPVS